MKKKYEDVIASPTITEQEAVTLYDQKMKEISSAIQESPNGEVWVPAVVIGVGAPQFFTTIDPQSKLQRLHFAPSPVPYEYDVAWSWDNTLPVYTQWFGAPYDDVDDEYFNTIEESGRRMREAAIEAGISKNYWLPFMSKWFGALRAFNDKQQDLVGAVVEVRYMQKAPGRRPEINGIRPVTVDASNVADLLPYGHRESMQEGCHESGFVQAFRFEFPTPTYKSYCDNTDCAEGVN